MDTHDRTSQVPQALPIVPPLFWKGVAVGLVLTGLFVWLIAATFMGR